jgi:hypothetical protein
MSRRRRRPGNTIRRVLVIYTELKCRPWEIPCIRPDPPDDDDPGLVWERLAYLRFVALERVIGRSM